MRVNDVSTPVNWRRTLMVLSFTFITSTCLSFSIKANTFEIGEHKVKLPFPEEFLTEASDQQNQLVFFDPDWPAPRPIIQLRTSPFKYPSDDRSEFENLFREKKHQWLDKNKAQATEVLNISFDQENKSVISRLNFELHLGEFREWTRFEECPNGQALILKFMIPKEFEDSHKETFQSWDQRVGQNLCQGEP